MDSYNFLAAQYDVLTRDIDYTAWADYYISHFREQGRAVRTVLDLGCGTGSLCWELAARGYETIGADGSEEMLAAAMAKRGEGTPPLFICQKMDELDLYGTVDAAVCMLDGVNYVTEACELLEVFKRVWLFLEPGGFFIFDINTPLKFERLDGELFLDESDSVYCVWQAEFDRDTRICTYYIDIFEKQGSLWKRNTETHSEFAYNTAQLDKLLYEVGFTRIEHFGELSHEAPSGEEERVFFRAWKGNE